MPRELPATGSPFPPRPPRVGRPPVPRVASAAVMCACVSCVRADPYCRAGLPAFWDKTGQWQGPAAWRSRCAGPEGRTLRAAEAHHARGVRQAPNVPVAGESCRFHALFTSPRRRSQGARAPSGKPLFLRRVDDPRGASSRTDRERVLWPSCRGVCRRWWRLGAGGWALCFLSVLPLLLCCLPTGVWHTHGREWRCSWC